MQCVHPNGGLCFYQRQNERVYITMNNIFDSEIMDQLQVYIHDLEQYFKQRDDVAHTDIQIYLEHYRLTWYYYLVNNNPTFHTVFWLDH